MWAFACAESCRGFCKPTCHLARLTPIPLLIRSRSGVSRAFLYYWRELRQALKIRAGWREWKCPRVSVFLYSDG